MIIAVPKEVRSDEQRVALVPAIVSRLVTVGFEIRVEAGAGEGACISDSEFEAAGAHIVADASKLLGEADVVLKVGPSKTNRRGVLWLLPPFLYACKSVQPTDRARERWRTE